MLEMPVVIYREEQTWVAQALGVDVSSFGDTADEALVAIREALELYFEDPEVEVRPVEDAQLQRVVV